MHGPDLGPAKCLLWRRSRVLAGRAPKIARAQRSAVQDEHASRLISLRRNSWREEMRDACEVRNLEVLRAGSREEARFVDGSNSQACRAGVSTLPVAI